MAASLRVHLSAGLPGAGGALLNSPDASCGRDSTWLLPRRQPRNNRPAPLGCVLLGRGGRWHMMVGEDRGPATSTRAIHGPCSPPTHIRYRPAHTVQTVQPVCTIHLTVMHSHAICMRMRHSTSNVLPHLPSCQQQPAAGHRMHYCRLPHDCHPAQ